GHLYARALRVAGVDFSSFSAPWGVGGRGRPPVFCCSMKNFLGPPPPPLPTCWSVRVFSRGNCKRPAMADRSPKLRTKNRLDAGTFDTQIQQAIFGQKRKPAVLLLTLQHEQATSDIDISRTLTKAHASAE